MASLCVQASHCLQIVADFAFFGENRMSPKACTSLPHQVLPPRSAHWMGPALRSDVNAAAWSCMRNRTVRSRNISNSKQTCFKFKCVLCAFLQQRFCGRFASGLRKVCGTFAPPIRSLGAEGFSGVKHVSRYFAIG